MFKQLGLTDLIAAIKQQIEADTDLTCYDVPPENAPSPLVYAEISGLKPDDTKTMYCKLYTVWLHVIAEEIPSSVPIHKHIQAVQEAMTDDITLPDGFGLVYQMDNGIQTIKTDETGEKHAILEFEFKISFAYKVK